MNPGPIALAALLVSCASMPALPQDAAAAAKAAIEKTRSSSSYRVAFKAVAKVPKSDPVVTEGESVWVNPGVLYIHSRATGGKEQWIVRTGKEVDLYSEEVGEWADSVTLGQSGAGRGVENPDEMLAVLANHLDKVSWAADKKSVRLAMQGADIAKIAKESGDSSFDWPNCSATIDLALTDDGRIQSVQCTSRLAPKDVALAGKPTDYSAEIKVLAYEKDRELKFELVDPKTKKAVPLELAPELKAKVEAQLKKK